MASAPHPYHFALCQRRRAFRLTSFIARRLFARPTRAFSARLVFPGWAEDASGATRTCSDNRMGSDSGATVDCLSCARPRHYLGRQDGENDESAEAPSSRTARAGAVVALVGIGCKRRADPSCKERGLGQAWKLIPSPLVTSMSGDNGTQYGWHRRTDRQSVTDFRVAGVDACGRHTDARDG